MGPNRARIRLWKRYSIHLNRRINTRLQECAGIKGEEECFVSLSGFGVYCFKCLILQTSDNLFKLLNLSCAGLLEHDWLSQIMIVCMHLQLEMQSDWMQSKFTRCFVRTNLTAALFEQSVFLPKQKYFAVDNVWNKSDTSWSVISLDLSSNIC